MIIDLVFASGDLRLRTRSTPTVRHAVQLVRAVLELGDDGHLTLHASPRRLPQVEFDDHYRVGDAIETLLRYCTNFETEEGLALLARRVRRDARLPEPDRRAIISRVAPTLVVGGLD
jgi:hypothetical protein